MMRSAVSFTRVHLASERVSTYLVDPAILRLLAVELERTSLPSGFVVLRDLNIRLAAVADLAEAEYVLITAGRYDVLVEVLCEDNESLLSLVNDRLRSIDGVASTEVFSVLKTEKMTFFGGAG